MQAPYPVLVLGGGKIGSLITLMLLQSKDYRVTLADIDAAATHQHPSDGAELLSSITLDVSDRHALESLLSNQTFVAVVSCLPYYCNIQVADLAAKHHLHYFDLTEDVGVMQHIQSLGEKTRAALVPQCGLAPGFISIVTRSVMDRFESVDTVKMRVGALPVNPHNAMKYSLTWSTDGLINEYGNQCYGLENGELTTLLPLEGYETINIDGLLYEAFNTSGGLGTLAHSYHGKVSTMNYKTLRYPGHCEIVRLLMNDLKLNSDRGTLKRILEKAIPKTRQDVVLIYVSVNGMREGDYYEESYVKKIYPQTLADKPWSAIQITTASGMCAVVDIILADPSRWQGFIRQEQIPLEQVLDNRFGVCYRSNPNAGGC